MVFNVTFTIAQLAAFATGRTTMYLFSTQLIEFCLNTMGFQFFKNFFDKQLCIPAVTRATVNG